MAFRLTSLIVAGCLLSLVQQLGPSSQAMAADALFGQPRITAAIDETKLVRIQNDVVKAFSAASDRGVVADDFVLEHLQLQLQRSAAQEQAVEAFIDALHDPKSPARNLALGSAWRLLISSPCSAGSPGADFTSIPLSEQNDHRFFRKRRTGQSGVPHRSWT